MVAAGLARRCLVQLSYAIGVAQPLSIYVDTYGTGKKTDAELVEIIQRNWDMRPGVMGAYLSDTSLFNLTWNVTVRELNLQKPQYRKTACYGHFGMLFSDSASTLFSTSLQAILNSLGKSQRNSTSKVMLTLYFCIGSSSFLY